MNRWIKNILFIFLGMLVLGLATYYIGGQSIISIFEDAKNTMLNSLKFEFNSDKGWFTESGDEIQTIVQFKYSGGVAIPEEYITYDDEVVELYKDMYEHYYALDYRTEEYEVHSDELLLNNELYYLINLSSDEGNLVIAAKMTFDSEEDANEGITEEYVDALFLSKVELYVPNDKLGKYIDIATITKDNCVVNNEYLYSIYKLYEMNGHNAVHYVNHYNDGLKTSLITANTYIYEVTDNESYTETIPCDWTKEHERIADSIFADLFNITYTEDIVVDEIKTLTYDSNWIKEMFNKNGRFENIYEDDSMLMSALKVRALNDYKENNDPNGRNLVLQFGLFDTTTLKSRTFHLIVDVGSPTSEGYDEDDSGIYPVDDEYEWLELAEIVDGTYRVICSGQKGSSLVFNEKLDISTCVYNYDIENAYYHNDMRNNESGNSEIHGVSDEEVSIYGLVSLNEYDIPHLIFEKIFYYS